MQVWCVWGKGGNECFSSHLVYWACDCQRAVLWLSTQSCDCQHAVLWLSACSPVTVSMQSYDCQHAVIWLSAHSAVIWLSAHSAVIWLSAHSAVIWLSAHSAVIRLSAHSPITVNTQSCDCQHAVLWLSARSPMTVSTQSYECQHAVLWLSACSQHGFLSSLVIIVGCFFFFAFSITKTVTLSAHAGWFWCFHSPPNWRGLQDLKCVYVVFLHVYAHGGTSVYSLICSGCFGVKDWMVVG